MLVDFTLAAGRCEKSKARKLHHSACRGCFPGNGRRLLLQFCGSHQFDG